MISAFPEKLKQDIHNAKLLMVGAGGIGCELLKNLVLSGFEDIELIDLDTIDVSNLNRQFLFRKEHVGKSKAQVAKESAQKFNPRAKIVAYHDSIMSSDYGVDFFKKFTVVLNALDNRAARNHVNRMCLAADIPLVESGTAGYLGQVTVIKKALTECYECQPKPKQRTFPGCTIRNTPSEPIHCIVWAKHLFNQLFGEDDPDQDVSPDTEDPELAGEAGSKALENSAANSNSERKSTRVWAMENDYNPEKLFNKMFRDDIKYLLSMENLWKKRRPPQPLDWSALSHKGEDRSHSGIRDQELWSMAECGQIFVKSVGILKNDLVKQGDGGMLVWDKDDEAALDFVTCAANVRATIFGIPTKSRFDIKSMAGNIIPAIATTNAIIAGLIVMETLKILQGNIQKCKQVYLNRIPNARKKLLVPCPLDKPNPKCYVCSEKPEVTVVLNVSTTTVKSLEDKVIKGGLGMVAPDVECDDGKGTILISSEEGETEENNHKFLADFGIKNGSRLKCDDFLQVYDLVINIVHRDKLEEEKEFEIIGNISELQAKTEEAGAEGKDLPSTNGTPPVNGATNDADDLMVVEETDVLVSKKRKHSNDDSEQAAKRPRVTDINNAGDNEEIIVL